MRIRTRWTADEIEDDDGLDAFRRDAARRQRNTVLRYWYACPNRKCRRHRRCSGNVEMCHGIFWPVLPEELKVWWNAIVEAHRDGSSLRQARRWAESAVANWRRRQAQRPRDSI